jgi:transposase
VSFVFCPKHEYACPQVAHCPHLGGAALGTLVLMAEENDEWHEALLRQLTGLRQDNEDKRHKIEELQQQVEQLKAELKAERQKQFRCTQADEKESVEATVQGARKRGAPLGHPGWFRPTPTHLDRIVPVSAPSSCHHDVQSLHTPLRTNAILSTAPQVP